MDKLSKLKESIFAVANESRNRLHQRRKASGTLASRTHLAEEAWRRGQIERNKSGLPSRLIPKDRKLVKDHVIRAAEGLDFDPADFLYWCALNWDGIGAAFFQKAKSYPANPSIPWLIRCTAVYSDAYQQRESLDLSGAVNPSQRVTAQAVAAISKKADQAIAAASDAVGDLQAQLREAREENKRLRESLGLPIDDDPIYARASKLAARKITIGKYDEEPAPVVRRKPKGRNK